MPAQDAYQWLLEWSRETAYLQSVRRLLSWDQRTQIPPKGHAHRHEQLAQLARLVHQRLTEPQAGEMLARAAASAPAPDPEATAAVNLREWRRVHERATRVPLDLAEALARAAAQGQTAWEQTRPAGEWEEFRPYLERLVALKREEAEALGYEEEPYDALLEGYEPGETASGLSPLFSGLADALKELLEAVRGSRRRPDPRVLQGHFPREAQERFGRAVAGRLGYDLAAGRLDSTAHPFTSGIGPGDARITTRYDEHHFSPAFFSILHEAGHAMYHQGLPEEHWGTPRGQSVSLGIHESQSRLWENMVGRSLGFWRYFYPPARETFPAFEKVSLETFHFAVNEVKPELIRTEADEVTYNLHVLLRFELERALIKGELAVEELPGAWNEKMSAYLGLVPPGPSQGVMQDVHWPAGHFGYFPTYTLGNLYAAQFQARAAADLGDLEESWAQGNFAPLLEWLRQKVHRQGKRYRPRQLVRVVTGEDLSPRYLVDYLHRKFSGLYGVDL